MINFLRNLISDHHPLRLLYHKVVAFFAALLYGFPSRHLQVISVTGTCGKSTTCHFIADILTEAGHKVGLATTIGFRIGDKDFPNATKMTTVGRFALQKLLRRMVKSGCRYAVIEATSHALIQSRLFGISVDTAVLTNMSGDHIEYHGSFEKYQEAKGRLFEMLSRSKKKPGVRKKSILNVDDPTFDFFDAFPADEKYGYGIQKKATFFATDVQEHSGGVKFLLHIPKDSIEISIKLPGKFNVYNVLAAASVAVTERVDLPVIKKALEKFRSLPGRCESIEEGQPFRVIVDYAHTEHALQLLLEVFKKSTQGRLFLVFGAPGGGRDKNKRPKMGAVAHALADYIVVTSDDPYLEDEWEIIDMVSEGIPRKEGENFWKIANRKLAIEHALSLAGSGDTVIIAGKGCEPVQMIYGERRMYDDRDVAREILKNLCYNN